MIYVTKPLLPPLEEYIRFLGKIWESQWLTNNGELSQLLTDNLKSYLKIKNLALMCNGTISLQIALRALNIKGEVITTPFTFAATTNALLWEGLTPVFTDIDQETFNIDPSTIENKITSKTSAILAVHIFGNPCFVDQLQEIADKHNLKIIYDAAHAFGVEYKNQPITAFGDVATLSFHATKVFNTVEGGAVISKDEKIMEQFLLMRDHGIKSEEEIVIPGINAKMNEFQAAMGLCNLKVVDEAIQKRKTLYYYYLKKLKEYDCITFQKIIASKYNYGYMPILFKTTEQRDTTYSILMRNGIKSRKYFFPLTPNFSYFKKTGINFVEKYQLINADNVASRILCIPLYPDLDILWVDKIAHIIKSTCK